MSSVVGRGMVLRHPPKLQKSVPVSHPGLAVRLGRRPLFLRASVRLFLLGLAALLTLCAPSVANAAKEPLKLVTIGDSYTAGNGANGPGAGPRGCSRRKGNWGNKFMAHLKTTYAVTYVNRACSGAVIGDVLGSQAMGKNGAADVYIRKVTINEADVSKDDARARRALLDAGRCRSTNKDEIYSITATKATQIPPPQTGTVIEFRCVRRMQPQIKAITKDTDLVVLSLGGNDVRFSAIIQKCFVPIAKGPGGCRKLVDEAKALLPEVQADLTAALRAVKKRLGTDAKIVVNSYPYLEGDEDYKLGRKGTDTRYAAGLGVRNFQDRADAFELAAINDVNNEPGAKVKFLDQVKNRFAGHEPKAALTKVNPDSWLHGLDTLPRMDNYHYNPQGHTEVKKLLVDFSPITATRSQVDDGPIDFALVVDTSGSMGGPLAQIGETAADMFSSIAAKSTSSRFALVDYRDFPERTGDPSDYAAALQQDFTTDVSAVSGAVGALNIGYGGDDPETMYSGSTRLWICSGVTKPARWSSCSPTPTRWIQSRFLSSAARA